MNCKHPKIAIVAHYVNKSAGNKKLANLEYETNLRERYICGKLIQMDYQVFYCYLTDLEKQYSIQEDTLQTYFFPVDNRKCENIFFTSVLLGEALQNFNPDITIFKGMGHLLPYWLYKNRYITKKIAFIIGGCMRDICRPITDFVYAEGNLQLKKQFSFFEKNNRANVLGKYIPEEYFIKDQTRDIDIISIGRIVKDKNIKALIPLFEKKYNITILGDGPELHILKEAAKGFSNVTLTGKIDRPLIANYLKRARLMVHPSLSEGFPRVFAEAFACGVPVIALKKAIKGDFPENKAGWLVDEQELVSRTEILLSDKSTLEEFSQNAYNFAEQTFKGDIIFNQFMNGINRMIEIPARGQSYFCAKILLALRKIYFIYRFWRGHLKVKLFTKLGVIKCW